jgi:hypothetical protein
MDNLKEFSVLSALCRQDFSQRGWQFWPRSAIGLRDAVKVCPPAISMADLTLSGIGGLSNSNGTFVLYTTTDVSTPPGLWTSIYTNRGIGRGIFCFSSTRRRVIIPGRQPEKRER